MSDPQPPRGSSQETDGAGGGGVDSGGVMAMRATTVRFSEDLWRLLEEEAAREGVSAAQYVRDATVMRVGYTMGRRGDAAMESALARIGGGTHAAGPARPDRKSVV